MMLRIVLVGIVAGLGITFPRGPKEVGVVSSVEHWASSVFADWEDGSSSTGGRHATRVVRKCELCRQARALNAQREKAGSATKEALESGVAAKKTDSNPPVIATTDKPAPGLRKEEPIITDSMVTGEDIYASAAFELDRMADAKNDTQPLVKPVSRQTAFQMVRVVETFGLSVPSVFADKADERFAGRTLSQAITTPTGQGQATAGDTHTVVTSQPAPAVNKQPDRPVALAQPTSHSDAIPWPPFAPVTAKSDVSVATVEPSPQIKAPAAGIPWPVFAPVLAQVEPPQLIANQVSQPKDKPKEIPWPTFAPVEPTAQIAVRDTREVTVPWPVFAPTEPPSTVDVAREAAPAAQPVGISAPAKSAAASVPAWSHAADLTRRATQAWLDLLVSAKPVKVTVR